MADREDSEEASDVDHPDSHLLLARDQLSFNHKSSRKLPINRRGMKIATVQFSPRLGDVDGNIRRADELLASSSSSLRAGLENGNEGRGTERGSLDLLVLPEMAFSGYNFSSLKTIGPYLEPTESGPSSKWARSTAQRLGCVVCVGYPEIAASNKASTMSSKPDQDEHSSSKDPEPARFNSLIIVDSSGDTLSNYQKRFLYYTDETWAYEGRNGEGFFKLPVREPETKRVVGPVNGSLATKNDNAVLNSSLHTGSHIPTSVGICMDINPYKFIAPYTAYEFANQVRTSGAKLVIVSMAWLTLLSPEELRLLADRPDMDTFQYWIQRFWPLICGDGNGDWDAEEEESETILVFANRSGEEQGLEGCDAVRYAGTSCVLGVRRRRSAARGSGRSRSASPAQEGGEDSEDESDVNSGAWRSDVEIVVWEMLGRAEEGVCIVDTDSAPKKVFKVRSSLG